MIFIVSGPGGVGKGTLVARLMEAVPGLSLSRSWTTRARRPREAGDAYVFVDRAEFEARIEADGFLEWTEFPGTGNLYGTPALESDGDAVATILEIELDGAEQVKRRRPDSVLIFITAPTISDQEARLRGRGDNEDSIRRRLEIGAQEMAIGARIADHVVVNDELERATKELAGIVEGCLNAKPR